jgi:light-independent protochlorophyllide reductase subunit B
VAAAPVVAASNGQVIWLTDAENELKKIPFFVRGKARRNTENYANGKGVTEISVETLYEAKAHYAR